MKPALWLLFASGILCASQTLTLDQQQTLKTYNRKPSQSFTVEERMKSFAKLSKTEAQAIARPFCKKDQTITALNHKNGYLFYSIKGADCDISVNALDGSIISPEALYE